MNPRSLEPTESFQIYFYTSDNYLIYQGKEGLTVTMTTPNKKTNVTITQNNGENGVVDGYLMKVANNNEKIDGDYIVINAPDGITFS